jgi:hypothetical protein
MRIARCSPPHAPWRHTALEPVGSLRQFVPKFKPRSDSKTTSPTTDSSTLGTIYIDRSIICS